jgi:tRNA modification GTPase
MHNYTDTISAIATPPGVGGIGIVRISGPSALLIAKKICSKPIEPNKFSFHCFNNTENEIIDQGVALFFQQPHSFTGDDVIELHAHGSPVVLQLLLQECLKLGARLAEPGEFTKRAYLNNKIDLSQAEAVIDLINATTAKAAKSAIQSLSGKFSNKINGLLNKLIELRTFVEASLDFPEEEIDFIKDGQIKEKIQFLLTSVQDIIKTAQFGKLLREGVQLVLIGQPNVGKSSLLNQLLGEEKAIVTELPGTTRDPVSSQLSMSGIPVNVIDTAGLRETNDIVENIGITKTWASIQNAGIIIFLVDAREGITIYEKNILKQLPKDINIIWAFNKIDLVADESNLTIDKNLTPIMISAKFNKGIDLLQDQILKQLGVRPDNEEQIFIARERHIFALNEVNKYLNNAINNLKTPDLCAEDLNLAQKSLSQVTGAFSSEDLLGEIFSQFCIGK